MELYEKLEQYFKNVDVKMFLNTVQYKQGITYKHYFNNCKDLAQKDFKKKICNDDNKLYETTVNEIKQALKEEVDFESYKQKYNVFYKVEILDPLVFKKEIINYKISFINDILHEYMLESHLKFYDDIYDGWYDWYSLSATYTCFIKEVYKKLILG